MNKKEMELRARAEVEKTSADSVKWRTKFLAKQVKDLQADAREIYRLRNRVEDLEKQVRELIARVEQLELDNTRFRVRP